MSLGSLFSSPTKQAQAAATATGNESQATIGQIENYETQQQQQQQAAIAGMGPNPYFQAAGAMSPSAYAVNPNDTTTFGSAGPGTTFVGPNQGQPIAGNPFSGPGLVTTQPVAQRAPSDTATPSQATGAPALTVAPGNTPLGNFAIGGTGPGSATGTNFHGTGGINQFLNKAQ